MHFNSQDEAIQQLTQLKNAGRQSVLIEGPKGCGKSYLARYYAQLLGVADFQVIAPKVKDIRDTIEGCYDITNPVVICIENLDLGVKGSAYSLLKFLEEPQKNVYIVVTARNLNNVPDTIISRSAIVSANLPTLDNLAEYASAKDLSKYNVLKNSLVWKCARSFSDVDAMLSFDPSKINFYQNLKTACDLNKPVSDVVWAISHYPNSEQAILELVIRCLMETFHTQYIVSCGISCISDLERGSISSNAILSKFVLDIKYCE